MNYYSEPARDIPVINTEVLVIGSGPAGVSAAYTSALLGRKTMIVEQDVYKRQGYYYKTAL